MIRAFVLLTLLSANGFAAGVQDFVTTSHRAGDFELVWEEVAADVFVDSEEPSAVRTAATLFAEDVQRVTGRKPVLKTTLAGLSSHAVIVGTLGESQAIQELVDAGKINGAQLAGKWETFLIQIVPNPFPGVETGLVIAGSDRRGAMYGVFEVSKNMGVSPWYWFADVHCEQQTSLVVKRGTYRDGPPSVKYRGIFINDEMWSLRPWAMNAHPDEGHGLGPKTYRRIFEFMARLRANCLWPAMHNGVGGTTPFNVYEENKVVADEFAIVMGSSHIEPMLRNNISGAEWDREYPGEPWNYLTNKDHIYKYWEDRVKANGRYENIYTVGKRGKDDEAGSEITVDVLERIFADQRTILKEWVNPDVTKVPQVLIPYTEVLGYYNKGLRVPDDITICWPDNNYGYIRQLPNRQEQARTGGSGVYYHYQWLTGAHHAHTWLSTTPPGLTWSEMKRAYDYNVNRLWVVNVGDIKPEEIIIEYFMQLAWDMKSYQHSPRAREFFVAWATRDFGAAFAIPIADILERHFELGYARRPEHMVMKSGNTVRSDWFALAHYNDEAGRRIAACDRLIRDVDALYARLPRERKDAFFEMVIYNVKTAALHNKKAIYAHKSAAYGAQKRASAAGYADLAQAAADEIDAIIKHYNTGLVTAGDKWNRIASLPGPWGSQFRHWDMPPVSRYAGEGPAVLQVALEGGADDVLAGFSVYNKDKRFVDLYNSGTGLIQWSAECNEDWIRLSQSSGEFAKEQRIWVTIDWNKAPSGEQRQGSVVFEGTGEVLRISVPLFNPLSPAPDQVTGFVESHGYVSIEAEHYSRKTDQGGAGWASIPGLGRTGGSITVQPPTVVARTSIEDIQSNSPLLEYDLFLFSKGELSLTLHCIPTEKINADYGQRIAVAIDDGAPTIFAAGNRNMFSNLMTVQTRIDLPSSGRHTLKLWMVDPGMVLDKIILDTGGLKDSYLGPPESFCGAAR